MTAAHDRGGATVGHVIRPAHMEDSAALLSICLRTGAGGQDATALHADPEVLGTVWVLPFLQVEPAHCLVVEAGDEVVGYVVGTPDTRAFEARAEAAYWPERRTRYPRGPIPGRSPADEAAVALVHQPPIAPDSLLDRYPGHLHIDLLPEGQGQGLGRQLITRMCESLAAVGCTGVHVGVDPHNGPALGFYRAMGFAEVLSSPDVLYLGLSLGGTTRT